MILRLLSAVILFAHLAGPWAWAQAQRDARSCGLVPAEVEDIYTQCHPTDVYRAGYCFWNALELARVIDLSLGQQIDLQRLRLVILFSKNLDNFGNANTRPSQWVAGTATRESVPGGEHSELIWKYHAFLEYQGAILDLDLHQSHGILSVPEFFDLQFCVTGYRTLSRVLSALFNIVCAFNHRQDVQLIEVPVAEYFSRFPQQVRAANWTQEQLDYLLSHPRESLDHYISRHRL